MALRKDPARRYGTVGELADDLRNYRASLPVRAVGDSWGYRAGKFLRRHRAAVASVALVVVAVSLLTVVYTLRLAEERNEARLQAARAEEVAQFLTGMFAEANPRNNLGEPMSARQMLDAGATRIIDSLVDQPELQAALMVTIGRSYHEMWENKAARDYLERAVEVAEAALGSEHPDVLRLRRLLGISMTQLGEPGDAQPIHEANYQALVRLHGADSVEAAAELGQLAVIDDKLGEHERAESRFLEAIGIFRRHGDAALDELAATLLDYGGLLRWLDRGAEEEPLLLEALSIRERRYGKKHPDYAAVVNNLGNHYFQRGEIETAARYMEEHISLQRDLVGEDGVPYGNALANYSSVQLAQGKIEESLATLDEAIAIFANGYGPKSIPYAFALENKANILIRLRRFEEADPLYRETLAIIGEQYGEDHKEYAFTQSNYGGMLLEAGRYEDGEVQLHEAVRKFSLAMSPDYSRTMLAQTKLVQCLWQQGKLDEALEVASAAEATARSLYNEPHVNLGQALRVLATVRRERGEYEKADALYRETVGIYEQVEERSVDWVTRTEVLFAGSLVAQARFDEARAMLERRDALLAEGGDEHAESRREIAEMLEKVDAAQAAVSDRVPVPDDSARPTF
jgi:tetratricopeptide (TPR) repeat protein